jgi:TPR repeat protein
MTEINGDEVFELALKADQNGDLVAAKRLYSEAAQLGNVNAMLKQAIEAYNDNNEDQFYFWTLKTAEAGHAPVMHHMGDLAELDNRFDEAKIWYLKAAEAGHVDAMKKLASIELDLNAEAGREMQTQCQF